MGTIITALMADLWPVIVAFVGALGWGIHQRRAGIQAERNKIRAREADKYEQHLQEIAAGHDARNRVDSNRMPNDDPYRRD